jgi:hypothetical protein
MLSSLIVIIEKVKTFFYYLNLLANNLITARYLL